MDFELNVLLVVYFFKILDMSHCQIFKLQIFFLWLAFLLLFSQTEVTNFNIVS